LSIEKTHKKRKLIARYLKLASSSEKIDGHCGGLHVVMSAHAGRGQYLTSVRVKISAEKVGVPYTVKRLNS
jgi:hypothetical protein